jgi:hypothetical protein
MSRPLFSILERREKQITELVMDETVFESNFSERSRSNGTHNA